MAVSNHRATWPTGPGRGPVDPFARTWARWPTPGPYNSHVNPMTCAWATTPRRTSSGLRAHQGVNVHVQGLTCEQHTMPGAVVPKTQTTSPLTARFQHFSPRWSALWAPHHLTSGPHCRQSGGIALHEAPTRRRHASRGLHVVQNPHLHRHGGRRRDSGAWPRRPWAAGPGVTFQTATQPHWCGGRRRDRRARASFEAWPGCGAGGRWRGLAGQHTDTPTDWRPPRGLRGLAGQHTATSRAGVEGAGGTGGHGRASRRGAEQSEVA